MVDVKKDLCSKCENGNPWRCAIGYNKKRVDKNYNVIQLRRFQEKKNRKMKPEKIFSGHVYRLNAEYDIKKIGSQYRATEIKNIQKIGREITWDTQHDKRTFDDLFLAFMWIISKIFSAIGDKK